MSRKLRRWQVLENLAKANGWRRFVELGVFRGQVAAHLLLHCKKMEWIGVDTWEPGPPDRDTPAHIKKTKHDLGMRSYHQHPLHEYRENVLALARKYAPRATVMTMTTLEAAGLLDDQSVDAVFVDACHETEAVMADIRAWAPKIRTGGLMTGHDIDMASVAEAVDRMVAGGRITCHSDSVWSVPVEEFR